MFCMYMEMAIVSKHESSLLKWCLQSQKGKMLELCTSHSNYKVVSLVMAIESQFMAINTAATRFKVDQTYQANGNCSDPRGQ